MDAKLSITTKCNAQCKTCPVWKTKGEDMSLRNFRYIWNKLVISREIDRILINNTGDVYNHPDRTAILKYIEKNSHRVATIMTTNAGEMNYIPAINELIISFNGSTKESYEYTTGLSFDRVLGNLKKFKDEINEKINNIEIHSLVWSGNASENYEEQLLEIFKDFPDWRIRVSYKYDNQMEEDKTLPEYQKTKRNVCEYTKKLSIMPSGRVVSCAHDFEQSTNWGNILVDLVSDLITHPARCKKIKDHHEENYSGLCENCNFNVPVNDQIKHLR